MLYSLVRLQDAVKHAETNLVLLWHDCGNILLQQQYLCVCTVTRPVLSLGRVWFVLTFGSCITQPRALLHHPHAHTVNTNQPSCALLL